MSINTELNLKTQARNQKFFRAGEISWNQGTLINLLLKKNKEKKPLRENLGNFFSLILLKTTPLIENLTQRWTKSGPLFPKSGHFFQFSK